MADLIMTNASAVRFPQTTTATITSSFFLHVKNTHELSKQVRYINVLFYALGLEQSNRMAAEQSAGVQSGQPANAVHDRFVRKVQAEQRDDRKADDAQKQT